MNEKTSRLARNLRNNYIAYIVCMLAFAITYELSPDAKGTFVGNAQMEYTLGTICVLLTISIVPLSIKIFGHLITKHKSLKTDIRIERYRILCNTRILCFAIVTVFDLWAYYATLNNIGGFCALICVAASLLFLPTRSRIGNDLGLEG